MDTKQEERGQAVDDRTAKIVSRIVREAENVYRVQHDLPRIGEGWISETYLFKQIEAAFTGIDVIQHASPKFLGRQHYDVYLPQYKIALEYQGEQHDRPVARFGGEKQYIETIERDERKKQLSSKNGIYLIYVYPDYDIEEILLEIAQYIQQAESKYTIDIADLVYKASQVEISKSEKPDLLNALKEAASTIDKETPDILL